MKKGILFLGLILLNLIVLSSCSKDDENSANDGFNVNGEGYRVDGLASCDNSNQSFSVILSRGPEGYELYFSLTNTLGLTTLKAGDDVANITMVEEFRNFSDFSIGEFSENISGKLIVKSISNSAITLEFKEFTFIKLLKGTNTKTYKMNGSITFRRLE